MRELTRPSRTTGDLILGGLVVLLGLVILGHTLVATTLSVVFLGWLLFAGGVVTLAATMFRIGKDGFWTGALGGGLMTVLGVVLLRHTSAAAVRRSWRRVWLGWSRRSRCRRDASRCSSAQECRPSWG
jgi:uncharacterized membrane protein HdeD (DUF308 family)